MSWPFVGRTAQIEQIREAVINDTSGPIMIIGEPGMGRTTVLHRALAGIDLNHFQVTIVTPSGFGPLSALRQAFPDQLAGPAPDHGDPRAAARLVAARTHGRRLVVAVDDADRVDQSSLLALRELSRRGRARLVLTRRRHASAAAGPDPTDCLRYEPGARTVRLAPLGVAEVAAILAATAGAQAHPASAAALHAATAGNPAHLRDLLTAARFTAGDAARCATAARQAWQRLEIDRAEELCQLALRHGPAAELGAIWAELLLLRGRAGAALEFLDGPAAGSGDPDGRLALVRAMCLALGQGRPDAAGTVLSAASEREPDAARRHLAHHAWLLAVTGRLTQAAGTVHRLEAADQAAGPTPTATAVVPLHSTAAVVPFRGASAPAGQGGWGGGPEAGGPDAEAVVFGQAARAVLAGAAGRRADAVARLRRALASAEQLRDRLPWLVPYLTGCLIDALLGAGRAAEATALAGGFHGGRRGSGWDVAVALAALTAARPRPVPEPPGTPARAVPVTDGTSALQPLPSRGPAMVPHQHTPPIRPAAATTSALRLARP